MQTWNEVSHNRPDELIRTFFLPSAGKNFNHAEIFFRNYQREFLRGEFCLWIPIRKPNTSE